ncbi:uncharacterized protein OCT59_013269 [Rhizophagus irregularis]|uniref:Uncharacterized protein n=2 Tax=Rhizophagus irregularis TaxID=588596 RepID=U9UEP5_RHIID|nr:hypothetical protein GLOIN_2v1487298 [Rhizophagus irregularis DAOM 181602=DAOM 197198]EXX75052.1 hypothetical protein RirG_045300 [Rhizophagus irregularis DAOM 197198w]UZO20859.1 hypothetical protein OCT59_013269 [Rhizophagus irregularis]POG60103.1 hypothetical protein GLOIN_2v1487298 [Rhizophagus irregularis DAOM 181602=DAOM 197198]CAG8738299.1 21699_t:CDS:1 [Rhizophagus irregularis]GBC27662.1 hypothetical protein GLOIN_2v1487298 [Rhizophagus irregularis DAOM 181602=DAOM 197198]|eukprot:XP_025166969.1 hypothetical protein GLOIN_2v1487298 [Rhizophagus irregularis DAOM 181602=DAOM 197198]
MNQNTLQNNQNDPTFTEFNNSQPTVIQPGYSSNINYNDVNVNSSDNNLTTFYTNTNYSDQHPPSNENISTPIVSSYAPQNVGPQQPIENIPFPHGSSNMTTIHPSQSEILSFDIPGFKIIVIPTFSQQDNTHLNYSSSDITNTQFTQF